MTIAWRFLFLIPVITFSHIAAQPYRTNKICYVPVTRLQIPISENEEWDSGGCDAYSGVSRAGAGGGRGRGILCGPTEK